MYNFNIKEPPIMCIEIIMLANWTEDLIII